MRFLKFALQKAYFDEGYGLTSYFKYAIAVFGVASLDVSTTMIMFFVYGIICYFLGLWSFKSGFKEAQIEVGNIYNLFVKQMRKKKVI